MTNFEYYKEQIKAIGFNFGIARSGKLLKCSSFPCVDCAFHCNECSEYKFEWLCKEHEEQPKLTKNERKLCEIMCPINPNNECNECVWGVYPSDWGSEYECSITLIRKMLEKMNNTKTII